MCVRVCVCVCACVCVTERASCHSYVPSSKRRARLKWQLVIWLSSPDWEERRRTIRRPLQSFISSVSFCFLLFTNICLFLSFALLSFSLAATTGVSRLTVTWIVVFLHKYMLIQMYWIQLSYSVFCLTLHDGVGTLGGKGVRRLWLSLHVYVISYQRYFASSCLLHQHECFWLKRKKLIWSLGTSGFHPLSFSYANSFYLINSGISCVCVYMSVYQGPCYKN